MSIPLTGTAGFFVRSGAFIGEYNRVAAFYGSALTNGFQSIWSQFASSDQAAVQNLPNAVAAFGNTDQTYLQTLQQDGALAITLQTSDYYSVVPYTVQQALLLVIAQMKSTSQSIQRATLTSTVTPWASNLGNANVVTSTINQFGDPLDMIFAEDVRITCVNPSPNYGETLQAVGQATVPTNTSLWPAGSGANATFTVTDQTQNGIVTDGDFEQWSGTGNNTPNNWIIVNGDAGVNVTRITDVVRGSYAAQLDSDGSQLTQLAQDISVQINTVYAVCIFAKVTETDNGTGRFRIAFTDGDSNVLNNDAGTALSSILKVDGSSGNLTSGDYAMYTAFFSTPRQLPTTVRVQYGYSVIPSAGRLEIDLAGVIQATQLYAGGPFMAAFASTDPNAVGDYYDAVYTNNQTSKSFSRGSDRLFSLRQLGLYYPSNLSSPTISNSLVTN